MSGKSTEYCSKQFLGECEYIKKLEGKIEAIRQTVEFLEKYAQITSLRGYQKRDLLGIVGRFNAVLISCSSQENGSGASQTSQSPQQGNGEQK